LTTNTNTIEADVIELLAHKVPADIKVTPQTKIVGDLGLDSVAVLDFIMDVEDHFNISIPLDRVAEVQTIAELSYAIEGLKRAAG
jgi:acyl carrier protein